LKVADDGTVDLAEFESALKKAVGDKLEPTFLRGGQDGLVKLARLPGGRARILDLGVSFDVVPERAIDALKNHAISLARNVTETELADLNKTIQEGMAAGESISALTDRVQEALSEEVSWKAERNGKGLHQRPTCGMEGMQR
jgi:hypothetical protein